MKFGKLSSIEGVDFQLPSDPAFNEQIFKEARPAEHSFQFYIGATGWSNKEWVGSIYPPKTKTTDFLYHYSRQFDSIELNTTHYRIPSLEMVVKWRESVPSHFRFCPKIPQLISHRRGWGIASGALSQFCENIQLLEHTLGCCFIQLPPNFVATRLEDLKQFLNHWPDHIPLAVEVRHPSWFEHKATFEGFVQTLTQYGISAVITDVAGRRDTAHMYLSSLTTMIRFVGNHLDATDYQRMETWIDRLSEWKAKGLQEVYFFPHQPSPEEAAQISVDFAKRLQASGLDPERATPAFIQPAEGTQGSLF